MIYRIKRSSGLKGKPCDKSVKKPVSQWEIRTCTEVEFNDKFSAFEGFWKSKGKNHSITSEGFIVRQLKTVNEWCIDISEIVQLMELVDDYGQIEIGSEPMYGDYPEITIIDEI